MNSHTPNPKPSEKAQPIKCFGHWMPLYPSEQGTLCKDMQTIAKARKHEQKARNKAALAATDAAMFKKASYNYLSSLLCLIAAMIEVNMRRPFKDRLSLREIIVAAKAYKVLLKLDESVNVYRKPKSPGQGFRIICDYGPVARGAQRMVLNLLRETYSPAPFQFTSLGVHKAIKEALRLITEEGYTHVAEIDIKDHYPNFEEDKLLNTVPLPKGAIQHIVLGSSAKWTPQGIPSSTLTSILHQIQLGIPQGSASSSVVAEWSVSQLKMIKVKNVALINYADNFFLFAKNATSLKFALVALRSAIAGLPGGSFTTHSNSDGSSEITTVENGFCMLGCKISKSGDTVDVFPTDTSQEKLQERFQTESKQIAELFAAAANPNGLVHRFEAVQAYLRLKHYVASWMSAYSFCTDIATHQDDKQYFLTIMQLQFKITDAELKAAHDPSVEKKFYPRSAWKKP